MKNEKYALNFPFSAAKKGEKGEKSFKPQLN